MDNIFSFQRFVWLFNKYTREHYKSLLMSVVVLAGILAMILVCIALIGVHVDSNGQDVLFAVLFVGMGFVFTSSIFADLGNKHKSISELTLPVAHLERFLVAWIYSFIIFQIVYIPCFFLINGIVINLSDYQKENYEAISILGTKKSSYFILLTYYCFVHAFAFLAAVLFRNHHFLKTTFSFIVFYIVLMMLNHVSLPPFIGSHVGSHATNFSPVKGYIYTYDTAIFSVMILASAFCLWTATYFKLKEKQV